MPSHRSTPLDPLQREELQRTLQAAYLERQGRLLVARASGQSRFVLRVVWRVSPWIFLLLLVAFASASVNRRGLTRMDTLLGVPWWMTVLGLSALIAILTATLIGAAVWAFVKKRHFPYLPADDGQ